MPKKGASAAVMGELKKKQRPRIKTQEEKPPSTVARAHWPRMAELRSLGRTTREIAAELGRAESLVYRTTRHPEFLPLVDALIAERRALMHQDLVAFGLQALTVIRDIAIDEEADIAVRLRAACDLADRAGAAAPKRLELTGAQGGPVQVATLTPESLAAMTPAQLAALTGVQYAPTGGEDDGSSSDEE